ncbi:uncharacterized protein LOC107039101 isoform X2 [Diachasma alloeum]|uniref:uncharacterized protein LOC107039101 isoform X2 n=1 Tax=Diachasma alloeum TaxID=454923 RepID=UPI000738516D|nr:uncharacterized protein LOC107039101 isoform X2 [Diachasma alloeum]
MEQFEQLLTCAICLDRYRNPKLLPCQHSFCMEPCMDGLIDYVRRQVKCPECRAEHRIPYQGVQAFPTNVTLQRFLELHIEITGELPDPTSGQTMERCGVCSEKSYCSLCVHCDKKCCPECKDAHMDILRREITRINSQVRRGLHRLQDALALVEKNTLGLQTNCASVAEEVDEIYRRLSKALKDRTEYLRNEIERYSGTELRGLIQLKENLELEIANIQSNCDLADAHINENVAWDDAELLDTKELFLRTVEFIRNFEYEAGDYGRRVRFVMPHEPNQLVLHVAGYGELNIKHETGSNSHLGTGTGLAPPGSSPGLMRSKSDHRLASQYRQQEEDRLARNRYVPDYEYDNAPDYESPRNKSRYRSRFMRHRDGEESDGDSRSTVRFTPAATETSLRERVLDTEDAARGPLSGIFRLTDSPRVMKKLQECERAGKRKKEEAAVPQPQAPKPQVQARKPTPIVTKQASEDDEISKIKKQNKSSGLSHTESPDDRQTSVPTGIIHSSTPEVEHEVEEPPRRTSVTRRTSTEPHTQSTRSASSESSTGSESSGSGIRNTGAPFTTEEMKQKYLARTPPVTTSPSNVNTQTAASRETPTTPTSSPRPFQSRFLGAGNRAAPPPPIQITREETPKKRDVEDDIDDEETSSSSEETETETEESEQETRSSTANVTPPSQKQQRSEAAMARTDIGPLLARSAEARRGSKEDSPSTRYSSPRGSPAHSTSSPTGLTTSSSPSGYTSRFVNKTEKVNNVRFRDFAIDSGSDMLRNSVEDDQAASDINVREFNVNVLNMVNDLKKHIDVDADVVNEDFSKSDKKTIAALESDDDFKGQNQQILDYLTRVAHDNDRDATPVDDDSDQDEGSSKVFADSNENSLSSEISMDESSEAVSTSDKANSGVMKAKLLELDAETANNCIVSFDGDSSQEFNATGGARHGATSAEHLFDDQGWIVTSEDLEATKSKIPIYLTRNIDNRNDDTDGIRGDARTEILVTDDSCEVEVIGEVNNSVTDTKCLSENSEVEAAQGNVASDVEILANGMNRKQEQVDVGKSRQRRSENSKIDSSGEASEEWPQRGAEGVLKNDNDSLVRETTAHGDGKTKEVSASPIPMQMVTTIFCVSVLCYGVLTNLLLS